VEIKATRAGPPARRRALGERAGIVVLLAAAVALAFGAASTLAWASGWIWFSAVAGGFAAHRAWVAAHNPAVLRRRDRIGEGTERWDLAWVTLFWLLMLATPAMAGLDTVRWGRPPLPAWAALLGGALLAAGLALSAAAMTANPFFEGTLRLQPDQRVVDAGPYRRLRHPGYAGLALVALSGPLLLRSALTLAPAVLAAAWIVLRTALEDRLLRRRLDGYAAYAGRVRWRLLPGVW
jgi:protein-S-isoprenylcysteine O-methyltransferase Ste14